MPPLFYFLFIQVDCTRNNIKTPENCVVTSWCQVFLSGFIASTFLFKLIATSVPLEIQKREEITIEDFALLRFKPRRKAQALLSTVVVICAIFLLSALTTIRENQVQAREVLIFGGLGTLCCISILFLTEGYVLYKKKEKMDGQEKDRESEDAGRYSISYMSGEGAVGGVFLTQ